MPLRPPNEDLFDNSRMTFGEHLEELRKVLVRALLGIVIGVGIGMIFANQVVLLLKIPLTKAIAEFNVSLAEQKLKERNAGVVPLEFRSLLQQRVMAPHRVLVDPDQLNQVLLDRRGPVSAQSSSPTTRFNDVNVGVENVVNVSQKLIAAVGDDGDSANRIIGDANRRQIRAIWAAMSPDEQAQMRRWAIDDPSAPANVKEFLECVNRLASRANLYDDPAFAELMSGSPSDSIFTEAEGTALREMKTRIDGMGSELEAPWKCQINQWLIWSALFPDLPRPDIPFVEIDIWESAEVNAQSLAATEPFMIWMKAGLILGLLIASPWIFYQMWLFVAAGLYPHEQKYVYVYLPVSLLLFWSGAALAFFFVFDPVLKFLFQFNANMGIDPQPRIGEWMSFVLLIPLGFGIAFQLPIVMVFLNLLGIFSVSNYLEKWRVAVLVIFIVAMVLTPAEPISMILMAIPLTILYFLGIGMCHWLRPNRNPYRQAYDP